MTLRISEPINVWVRPYATSDASTNVNGTK